MLKRERIKSLNKIWLGLFALLISGAFICGAWATPAQAAKKVDAKKSIAGLVDINNASQKELEALPSIGESAAKKIVAGRPYKSVDELSKAGLSAKVIDKIKPLVTVGAAQAKPVVVAATKATSAVKEPKAAAQKAVAGLVDINNATQKELEALPSIGESAAKKIVAGRPYKSVDELSKAGLSAKVVDKIKPLVTVGGATAAASTAVATVADSKPLKEVKTTANSTKSAAAKLAPGTKININTADKSALDALPGIGSKKAQAIIDARPYKSIEDIMRAKGIKQKTFDAIKEYLVI
jgi:competence ComEA-like helix-hairpin-helix protein